MTYFTVYFRTDAECAVEEIEADTAELAMVAARTMATDQREKLDFDPNEGLFPINEIEVSNEDDATQAVWRNDELQLRLAARDLLKAARKVIAHWESGDLAEAVRELSAAVRKAEGGAA